MKKIAVFITILAAAGLVTAAQDESTQYGLEQSGQSRQSQQTQQDQYDQQDQQYQDTQGQRQYGRQAQQGQQYNKNIKASEQRVQRLDQLIGKDVTNWQDENLGEISDFVIDKHEGKVLYAVLSYGGIATGKKRFALPFDSLTLSPDGDQFILDIPQQRLDERQGFGDRWPTKADKSLVSGREPMRQREEQWRERDTQSRSSNIGAYDQSSRTPDGEMSSHDYDRYTGSESATEGNLGRSERGYYGRTPSTGEAEYPEATGQRRYTQRDYPETGELSEQHQRLVRASEIMGENVVNTQDENLGDIKDLAVDMREGRIPYAVVTHGGFLAMGEKYTAVPWKALKFREEDSELVLNIPKDKFDNAPTFTNDNWPNFADSRWGSQVHQFFGQKPYWETYGYSTYIGQSQQQQQSMKGWSEFDKKFDPAKIETIEGRITNVSSFKPQRDASEGTQIKIRTPEDKTVTVQLGPKSVLDQQKVDLARGEKVKVTGSRTEHLLRSVVIASELMTQDGKTIKFRDEQGQPVWQQQGQQQDQQTKTSGSQQIGAMDANDINDANKPTPEAETGAAAGGAASMSTDPNTPADANSVK
ncbi:MAG: hypothetical protein A2Y07_11990 [Planctomycetes bacterium GWF2_50_10]|nr:MAG: hypothetical protein A2Y07_11990 [Planctomycetes bacterium GWF2_50_10]